MPNPELPTRCFEKPMYYRVDSPKKNIFEQNPR